MHSGATRMRSQQVIWDPMRVSFPVFLVLNKWTSLRWRWFELKEHGLGGCGSIYYAGTFLIVMSPQCYPWQLVQKQDNVGILILDCVGDK